ncbi:farnesyl-diphosphate farnesyltransferase [Candidatus Koribacter versatilis Ellin345]|uniref:Farnesyl-diphosphate farnesyltransferase n=1 Tax=Koribacter versatilis (strain Ellin345) TaxID=204669 RepID=Q1IQV3_KORVE|nr:farnesyl-diphosphate farnesyltransferase [Candidatus Koribacter versatilis Ellin345]
MSAEKKQHPLQLSTAYAVCRHITRSQAKNFYYAFLVLPRRKRNALCAVYAFMRHADDISDDEAIPVLVRREKLSTLLDNFHRAIAGEPTDDPVLIALAHTQKTYEVPMEWLDKLVFGTMMDLHDDTPAVTESVAAEGGSTAVLTKRILTFPTFDDLYAYCYHVASVVGLVCIKIFGYRDPKAEKLAERTGIAFQLTNIIRDVKEDAAMSRVYLPERDLQTFGITPEAVAAWPTLEQLQPVLQLEGERAMGYYQSAQELVGLIDDDSQPALWALVEIYRQLMEKIAAKKYDVFTDRVRLTTGEKLKIVAKGLVRRLS